MASSVGVYHHPLLSTIFHWYPCYGSEIENSGVKRLSGAKQYDFTRIGRDDDAAPVLGGYSARWSSY